MALHKFNMILNYPVCVPKKCIKKHTYGTYYCPTDVKWFNLLLSPAQPHEPHRFIACSVCTVDSYAVQRDSHMIIYAEQFVKCLFVFLSYFSLNRFSNFKQAIHTYPTIYYTGFVKPSVTWIVGNKSIFKADRPIDCCEIKAHTMVANHLFRRPVLPEWADLLWWAAFFSSACYT